MAELDHPEGDLNMIMQLLQEDNYQVIPRVREISRKLTGTGLPLDFESNIDVEAILSDLITQLCTGGNRRFQGILILFDELYNYLQLWANDPIRAGSTTLQNITNICEKFKSKIALLTLSQRRPGRVIPAKNVEYYNRLVSRLELLPTTYEPAASLELVLGGLLTQQDKTTAWQEFYRLWRNTLNDITTTVFQNRTGNYYQSRNWTLQKFLEQITLGCFPLHPLTSYLLCNLDFTQGRTAIQFVQEDVKSFIQEQPLENNRSLNLIYPVALVDAFESNFANPDTSPEYSTLFSDYSYSANKVKISADTAPEEILVLKALLLFYASSGKLTKLDREKHEEFLSLLTGLPVSKVKETLDKLCQTREVIYHNPADNTYRFYAGGFGIDELRRRIREETGNKAASVERVESHCQSYITQHIGNDISPTLFIEQNRLCSDDWRFHNKVFTVAKFRQALFSHQTVKNIDTLGIVAYVVAETSEELLALANEIHQLLERSPIKGQVVVAITSQPIGKLARLLLENIVLDKKSVQDFGSAVAQLKQQYQKQILDITADLFKSCTYYCHIQDKISTGDRNHLPKIVSAVLQDRYPLVPPVEKNDKMALKSPTGSEVIGYVSKRLLENDLRPEGFPKKSYENVINPVFVNSWRLLKPTSQNYSVIIPTQRNIKAAWEKISEITDLGDKTEKTIEILKIWETLSGPPYGYNEYTFTILFASWLAYHRSEIFLKGSFGIPQQKSDFVALRTEPVKNWAKSDVFNKPKDFVNLWIKNQRPSLIRRLPLAYPEVPNSVDYEQAQECIQKIEVYLDNPPEPAKVDELRSILQKLKNGITQIQQNREPVLQAENLLQSKTIPTQTDIEAWLRLCSQLQDPLTTIFESGLSIKPTQQQKTEVKEILQTVIERIGQFIEAEKARSNSLATPADCGAYKTEIQSFMTQIRQVANLPPRFVETLQNAIQLSDIRLAAIEEQTKVDNCLVRMQSLYTGLSALATQDEYIDIQTQIESLVLAVPAARETDIYKNIIQSLEEKQDALLQQITDWERQFSPTISRPLALQLANSISQHKNRFTDENSKQRLDRLLASLENIILEQEREEQEELQTTRQDSTTMEAIRQYTLTKANTIHFCQEAIRAITHLQNQLIHPEQFQSEVENCLQGFTQKIATYKSNLQNLLTRLSQVETSQQINSIREEYAKLDFVFQDSSEYPAYQQLQTQITFVTQDIERIRHWESLYQQSHSIALCDRTLETLAHEQVNLHHIERFRPKLQEWQEHLRRRRQSYIDQLNELYNTSSRIKTLKDAQNLQTELTNKSTYYRESQEEQRYQAICTEVNLLISLLQISAIQKVDTIQDCQAERERLCQWQQNTENITATAQTLLDSLLTNLEQTEKRIETQQREAAKKWLDSIQLQHTKLEQNTKPANKLEAANELHKQITKQRHQHEQFLEAKQKQTLEEILNLCSEIQTQDKESKIFVLFQELPLKKREALLKKLAESLSATMEDF